MKIVDRFRIKWQSVNYLEEQISDVIWKILIANKDALPKHTKINLTLEFEDENSSS